MGFGENVSHLHGMFHRIGFTLLNDFYPIHIDHNQTVDCRIIAERNEFQIIYMETKERQTKFANKIVREHLMPCLVITKLEDIYTFTVPSYDGTHVKGYTARGGVNGLNLIIDQMARRCPSAWNDIWEINSSLEEFLSAMREFRLKQSLNRWV